MAQNATLDITACDLFPGITTRAWTPRDTQQELALCQRWYEKSYDLGVAPGTAGSTNGNIILTALTAYWFHSPYYRFAVTKRTAPAVIPYSLGAGASGKYTEYGQNGSATGSERVGSAVCIGQNGCFFRDTSGDLVVGDLYYFHMTADCSL